MKTLANPTDHDEIAQRLHAVRPASQCQWGKMTAPQMICHLSDALRICLGEISAAPRNTWFTRNLLKPAALWIPTKWPHGVKTVPECDADLAGTRPTAFEADLAQLHQFLHRFTTEPQVVASHPHPIFGRMKEKEWMRWGYLHADHHLRQFGA